MIKREEIDRLTPFEEYMFWDETPAFPMSSFQTLRFSGNLDCSVFAEALELAFCRHPLMNARIVSKGKRVYWEFLEKVPEIQTIRGIAGENFPPLCPPDIRKSAGVSIIYKECFDKVGGRCGTEVGFLVHHSVSDASGILSFFEDLLIAYALKMGNPLLVSEFQSLAEESMALRHDPGVTWKRYWQLLPQSLQTTARLLFHHPEPLLPLKKVDRTTPPTHFPLYRRLAFSAPESVDYRRRAKQFGATINDLLIRDIFLATADFKSRYCPQSNRWIRVAMPINMRPSDYPNLFATNIVSMVFLDRRVSQVSESDNFMAGIRRETEWIKRTDQGLALLENLKGCRNLPGGIQKELRKERCWATTVLSNLGVIFKKTPLPRTEDGRLIVGDAVLEEFCGMPPLRAQTLSSWGVWSYAGHLKFAAQLDERYLNSEQLDDAYSFFKRRIFQSVEAMESTPRGGEMLSRPASSAQEKEGRSSPDLLTSSSATR